jgi:hypothetical protein
MEVSQNKAVATQDSVGDQSQLESPLASYQFEPQGEELIETVVRLSGIDEKSIRNELETILSASGHLPSEKERPASDASAEQGSLTIEDLRASMLQYLEEMNRSITSEMDSSVE